MTLPEGVCILWKVPEHSDVDQDHDGQQNPKRNPELLSNDGRIRLRWGHTAMAGIRS